MSLKRVLSLILLIILLSSITATQVIASEQEKSTVAVGDSISIENGLTDNEITLPDVKETEITMTEGDVYKNFVKAGTKCVTSENKGDGEFCLI